MVSVEESIISAIGCREIKKSAYNSKVLTIVKMKGWKVKWNLTNRIYQLIIPIEEIDYRKY
jgi:hypothetical protein